MIERIYIHYPFCRRICYYCDFYKVRYKKEYEKVYLEKLKKEIKEIKKTYKIKPLSSLYLGGGSPSIASYSFFDLVFSSFSLKSNYEVSLEINIEDVSKDFLSLIKNYPINRISLGIQNFKEKYSNFLGRNIDVKLIYKALELISKNFENISLDLLILGLEKDEFEENKKILKDVLEKFNIKHISLYILTIYKNTYLYKKYPKLKRNYIDLTYQKYQKFLKENFFFQYEVSNFAKPNFLCQHNLAYWLFENYLGLGPSASSLIKIKGDFISKVNENKLDYDFKFEKINFETYLYFRFRTFFGVPFRYLKNKKFLKDFLDKNLIALDNKNIKVTSKGYLFLDYIFDKLFI